MVLTQSHDNKKLCAISYKSPTFNDLVFYLNKHSEAITLQRIEPDQFMNMSCYGDYNFINLVTKMEARQHVTQQMDDANVTRFSFITDPKNIADTGNIGLGSFIYPQVVMYPSAVVDKDIIVHGQGLIAHKATIQQGAFISGGVTLCGSCNIGRFAWIGAGVTVGDRISVPDYQWIMIGRSIVSNKEFRQSNHSLEEESGDVNQS